MESRTEIRDKYCLKFFELKSKSADVWKKVQTKTKLTRNPKTGLYKKPDLSPRDEFAFRAFAIQRTSFLDSFSTLLDSFDYEDENPREISEKIQELITQFEFSIGMAEESLL